MVDEKGDGGSSDGDVGKGGGASWLSAAFPPDLEEKLYRESSKLSRSPNNNQNQQPDADRDAVIIKDRHEDDDHDNPAEEKLEKGEDEVTVTEVAPNMPKMEVESSTARRSRTNGSSRRPHHHLHQRLASPPPQTIPGAGNRHLDIDEVDDVDEVDDDGRDEDEEDDDDDTQLEELLDDDFGSQVFV